MINFQESRSAAVLQFLEKVLKLKNKSKFESPLKRTDLKPWKEKARHGGEYKKSPEQTEKRLERLERLERFDALEKLFDIAGEDWDRQFVKKRKKEKAKKDSSFICPKANTFQHSKSFQSMGNVIEDFKLTSPNALHCNALRLTITHDESRQPNDTN